MQKQFTDNKDQISTKWIFQTQSQLIYYVVNVDAKVQLIVLQQLS